MRPKLKMPKPKRFDERRARREARRREERALKISRPDRERIAVGLPPDGSA